MHIIHPGFIKTATTTLQNNIFNNHSELFSIGRPWGDINSYFLDNFYSPAGYYNKKGVQNFIRQQQNLARKKGKKIILSDENLTYNYWNRGEISKKLFDLFGESKIIFTIRNQYDMIASYYTKHAYELGGVPSPYSGRYVNFKNWFEYCLDNWETTVFGIFEFNKIIEIYENIFGKNNIHILIFEEFRKDKNAFLSKIANILEVDAKEMISLSDTGINNRSDSSGLHRLRKAQSFFFPQLEMKKWLPKKIKDFIKSQLAAGPVKKINFDAYTQNIIYERYKEGNKTLSEKFNINLSEHNYPI